MALASTVPVLQVADVSRSIQWYIRVFRFRPVTFPPDPPYKFAILSCDTVELMLQLARDKTADVSSKTGWAAYLRVTGGDLLSLAKRVEQYTPIVRGPQRMPYGVVEFEVIDPDGHHIVVGEDLDADASAPKAAE